MDPISMQLLAIGGQGLLSAVGELLAGRPEAEARKILESILKSYQSVEKPQMELATDATVDQLESADPQLQAAQRSVLQKMMGIVDAGGMDAQMQADTNAVMDRVARQERSGRQAIQENMAARGVGGSGAELAMSLQNQQNAAEAAQKQGMDLAGQAHMNVLRALQSAGGMASGQMDQNFRERQAKNSINQFNAEARSRGSRDRNAARQQMHQNDLGIVDREARARQLQYGNTKQEAQDTRNQWNAYGAGVSKLGKLYDEDDE